MSQVFVANVNLEATGNNKIRYMGSNNIQIDTPGNLTINCASLICTSTTFGLGNPTMQVFTANGTWTKPANCRKIKVTVVGGGGGGGQANATASSGAGAPGGGGGGWSIKFIDVTGVSSQTVTVGLGGNGANTTAAATAGGTSTFGSYHTATGGGAAANAATSSTIVAGPAGGAGSSGDINGVGSNGGFGWTATTGQQVSGTGGESLFGSAAPGMPVITNVAKVQSNGVDGCVYGGGGSGATSNATTAGTRGGNGNTGIIIVEEFY